MLNVRNATQAEFVQQFLRLVGRVIKQILIQQQILFTHSRVFQPIVLYVIPQIPDGHRQLSVIQILRSPVVMQILIAQNATQPDFVQRFRPIAGRAIKQILIQQQILFTHSRVFQPIVLYVIPQIPDGHRQLSVIQISRSPVVMQILIAQNATQPDFAQRFRPLAGRAIKQIIMQQQIPFTHNRVFRQIVLNVIQQIPAGRHQLLRIIYFRSLPVILT
jgi:hypothetical protein